MSPIQLGTWAQLWILGLTAHSGGGLTLRTAEGVFRAQILPNAAWRIVGQRSGVSWEDQRSQFHVGQTPYGPGYSVQGTLSTGLFLAYLGPDVRWIQWTGLPGQVLRNASYSSQGLRLEGGWARWSFGIFPQGMSHLGWQGLQSQARWRFAPGRWEGQLQVYRAQITASGHPTWSSSRLRFAHRGRYLEFSEIHSKRGLVLQTMGRLPWRNHCLSFSIAPAPWPSWGGLPISRAIWLDRPGPVEWRAHVSPLEYGDSFCFKPRMAWSRTKLGRVPCRNPVEGATGHLPAWTNKPTHAPSLVMETPNTSCREHPANRGTNDAYPHARRDRSSSIARLCDRFRRSKLCASSCTRQPSMENPFGPGHIPLARAHTASRTWLDRGSHGFHVHLGSRSNMPSPRTGTKG